jgi:FkbM family methyltransferase
MNRVSSGREGGGESGRGMIRTALRGTRRVAEWCQTMDAEPSTWSRWARTLGFLPAFCPLVALLRTRTLFLDAVPVEGRTLYGHRMTCRPPDLVQMYLYLFGIWEPDLSRFVRNRLRPGETFVDVGSNVGYFSLVASAVVGDQGRVVSVEASPRIYQALQENLELNGSPANIRPVNMAASAFRGAVPLYHGPRHNVGLTTTVAYRDLSLECHVPAAPLHEILTEEELQSTSLVKIDVEGGEVEVLEGMMEFLTRARDDVEILLELSPNWWHDRDLTVRQVLTPFLDLGFHPYIIPNNYWPWRYLWPERVDNPFRAYGPLPEAVKRIDLVLSRVDAEFLRVS